MNRSAAGSGDVPDLHRSLLALVLCLVITAAGELALALWLAWRWRDALNGTAPLTLWMATLLGIILLIAGLWLALRLYRRVRDAHLTLQTFQRIVERLPLSLWSFDWTGRVTYANRAALEALGAPEVAALTDPQPLLRGGDGSPSLLAQLDRAWAGHTVTGRQSWPNGEHPRHFETTLFSLPEAKEGRPTIVVAQHDITAHRQAEANWAQSESRLRGMFDHAELLMALLNPEGLLLEANQALLDANARRREDVLGHSIIELPAWSFSPAVQTQLRHAIRDAAMGETVRFEAAVRVFADGPQTRDQALTLDAVCRPVLVGDEPAVLLTGRAIDQTERQRADTERDRRLMELESIQHVSAAMRLAQTLEEMLPRLLDETLTVLRTDAGALWLYDPVNGDLRVMVERGWCTAFSHLPIRRGEGIPGLAFQASQPYLTREFASDPRTHDAMRALTPPGWGGACVPIRTTPEVIGVFFVAVQLPREMSLDEVHLLDALSEITGNAIQRMRLRQQTEQRLQNLAALRAIDVAINSSLDLRLTLNVVVDQIMAQLEVDAADILLLDPASQTLEYAVGRGFRNTLAEQPRLRLGEGRAGRAALERRTLHLPHGFTTSPGVRTGMLARENLTDYYAVPLIAKGQVKGVLEIFHRTLLAPDTEWLNFLETLAGQAAIAIDNAQLYESQQRVNTELALAYDTTLEGWARALDLRDRETEGHTRRVTDLTVRLARTVGLPEAEVMHIRRGAILHDIGKMGVPDNILRKTGPLSDEEWDVMRQHPQLAFDMLTPIAYLRPALDIPYCHHEKWNGSGYPRGLKGEAIPLAARIFSVVDVWDALRSDRPYRASMPKEQVVEHIRERAGSDFDPRVAEMFLTVMAKEG